MTVFARCSLVLLLCVGSSAFAQAAGPAVPTPSPKARTDQTVGITDFSIEYSSPGVKGRKIWGALVPFDKPWRAGANAATKLTASRDFSFGDKKVPAGSYSLYTIPGQATWTFYLSTDMGVAQFARDEKKDVASVQVKPTTMPALRERLVYIFSDTTDTSTNLDLEWEKLRLRIPIKVDTSTMVNAEITKALDDAWRPHFTAARYLLDANGDLGKALEYVNTSISIKPTWWNYWVKALILGKTGKKADAVAAAEQAKTLGKDDDTFKAVFAPQVEAAIKGWK